jgi:hypothetical protein
MKSLMLNGKEIWMFYKLERGKALLQSGTVVV